MRELLKLLPETEEVKFALRQMFESQRFGCEELTSLMLSAGEEADGVQRRRVAAAAGGRLYVPAHSGAQVSPPHLSSKRDGLPSELH